MYNIPYLTEDALWGFLKLGLSAVLLILIFGLITYNRLKVTKEMAVAFIRGFFQIMIMSVVIVFVFRYPSPLALGSIVAVMLFFGSYTAYKSVKHIPGAFPLILVSLSIGVFVSLSWLFLVMFPRDAEFIIPIAGMAAGNGMNMVALSLERFSAQLKDNRNKVETYIALGATTKQATREFSATALRVGLLPNMNTLKTLGIVFIPGAMVGLLMAGEDPVIAAQYQLVVYIMIFTVGLLSSTIAMELAKRKLFTPAHQMIN